MRRVADRPSVVLIHPDLGIGGAERLVVDAALALKSYGSNVHILTSHHDRAHCFAETRDGSVPVTVAGDWLPRHICGRFHVLFATLRMIYASLYLLLFNRTIQYNVVFCDQVSACIPLFKLWGKRVVFYCHFPDKLLSTDRKSCLKRSYRFVFDLLEEWTTGMADVVLVNSEFTAGVFKSAFPSLVKRYEDGMQVLYPAINFSKFDELKTLKKSARAASDSADAVDKKANAEIDRNLAATSPVLRGIPFNTEFIFLSLNRYERKKNIALAIESLGALKSRVSSEQFQQCHLVVAGGYDTRVNENVQHHLELTQLARDLGLNLQVTFLRSISDQEKVALLEAATALIYTPANEHFGIVPLEAMYMRTPVLAVASGGPLETVIDNVTGFLCEPEPEEFADKMARLVNEPGLSAKFGEQGRKHVMEKFGFRAFSDHLTHVIRKTAAMRDVKYQARRENVAFSEYH